MNEIKTPVQWIEIHEERAEQRIDNFLLHQLKNVPKSLIYRLIRKGEVRVNKKRIKAEYKLQTGDVVRIPPLNTVPETTPAAPNVKLHKVAELETQILYEDEHLLVLNKPSGTAVHGGSGLKFGVIEALRALRPQARFLELVHRIDRDTSGLLLVAKKRSALRHLQQQFREKTVRKYYYALVKGKWDNNCTKIEAPLLKNEVNSIVRVNAKGKPSVTYFKIKHMFEQACLVQASPLTGRTHQIRVHCQHAGHPIAGDDRYGDPVFDALMSQFGLSRLFLHAAHIEFVHPKTLEAMQIQAPLSAELERVLARLKAIK